MNPNKQIGLIRKLVRNKIFQWIFALAILGGIVGLTVMSILSEVN